MDNLKSLFDKKQYDLVIKLTESSELPEERLLRLLSFVNLNEDDKALDEIESHQEFYDKYYPKKSMVLCFELLLKNKYFDEAKIKLEHYKNLPYISQEVEEYLRDLPNKISEAQNPYNGVNYSEEEISDILEKSDNLGEISEVLFSLKKYNLSIYIDSLKKFLMRKNIHPNLLTYGLILLVDEKYNEEISYFYKDKLIKLNPSKLNPPFVGKSYGEITTRIHDKSDKNITIQQTALSLLNYLVLDLYPVDIDKYDSSDLGDALVLIAKEYINDKNEDPSLNSVLKDEIKSIIEKTPTLKM